MPLHGSTKGFDVPVPDYKRIAERLDRECSGSSAPHIAALVAANLPAILHALELAEARTEDRGELIVQHVCFTKHELRSAAIGVEAYVREKLADVPAAINAALDAAEKPQ